MFELVALVMFLMAMRGDVVAALVAWGLFVLFIKPQNWSFK